MKLLCFFWQGPSLFLRRNGRQDAAVATKGLLMGLGIGLLGPSYHAMHQLELLLPSH